MRLIDVVAARRRLATLLAPSPLRRSDWLSTLTDASVYLKLESVQLTNSFKIRGAFHAAVQVLERADGDPGRAPLIVTASAGNHGRAMACACERLGLRAVVFTPSTAPESKRSAIRRHGAALHDDAPDYDAAEARARAFAAAHSALYVSPYNHPDVIAGAGTIALEILDVLPVVDVVVVPLGGGGLASGVGLALKAAAPRARVVAVEAAVSTPFAASLRAGRIVEVRAGTSLADGLTGNLEPGSATFELVQRTIDQLTSVEEAQIAEAIRSLAGEEHLIAEGAGAVATAAVMARRVVRAGETAAVIVTGANIDLGRLNEILPG